MHLDFRFHAACDFRKREFTALKPLLYT
jgi:hypothetical protein